MDNGKSICKVSIITPVKNSGLTLERTIRSVLSQTYRNIEYIIVDGNSTDETADIINRYRSKLTLIRENDESMYDAMNKGIHAASGSLIGILNADDQYSDTTVEQVVFEHLKYPNAVIHGDMLICDKLSRTYVSKAPHEPDLKKGQVVNHPSAFVPRSVVNKVGAYDPSFKIAGDWELFLRYKLAGIEFKKLNSVLVTFQVGGVSTSNPRAVFMEMHRIRTMYKLYRFIDLRFLRDKLLCLLFGRYVILLSYKKRLLIHNIKN